MDVWQIAFVAALTLATVIALWWVRRSAAKTTGEHCKACCKEEQEGKKERSDK